MLHGHGSLADGGAHADAAGVHNHVALSDLGVVAVVDQLSHRGKVLVDVHDQGLSAGLIEVGDVDLLGSVIGQHAAHSTAGAAGTEAEEGGLLHVDLALFHQGGVEANAVGIVADQLALGGLDHGVAGAHLLAQAVDHIAQVVLVHLGVEVKHVQTGGLITGVLHPGGERLAQRFAQQGDHFGVDVDLHNDPSLILFKKVLLR